MKTLRCLAVASTSLLCACTTGYALVNPGFVSVQDLEVEAGAGWNRVPEPELSWTQRGTQVWTQNGLSLDRLVLIPGVADGDSLYRPDSRAEYPLFRADMGNADLVDLVGRTIELAQRTNRTKVTATDIRSERFGTDEGVLFELEAVVHDGPGYRGMAGAFKSEGRLYVVYFLGASPFYYEQQSATALATIVSARR